MVQGSSIQRVSDDNSQSALAPMRPVADAIHRMVTSAYCVFDMGDWLSAALLAAKASERLRALLAEADALAVLFSPKAEKALAALRDDLNADALAVGRVLSESEADPGAVPSVWLASVLNRLEVAIRIVGGEARRAGRGAHSFRKVLKRAWRLALMLLGATALFVSGIFFVRHVFLRPYGLMGYYYANMSLEGAPIVRRDLTVNFDWRLGSPMRQIPVDHFSVRWVGYVRVPESGVYQFVTRTDDGVRLWIDGRLLIDRWVGQAETDHHAEIFLEKGLAPIRLEYFEATGQAVARLFWHRPGYGQAIVPFWRLKPSAS